MISIVVPCYNASRYLERLATIISSVAPLANEILLVDDCSTDDTYLKAAALGLPIIQTPDNFGPGGARNYGVEHLDGEWVHFLDADDLLSTEVFQQCMCYLDESIDVLLLGARWIGEDNDQLLREWVIDPERVTADPILYTLTSPIPAHCSILRVDHFRAIGGFDAGLRCWEDGDLHVRLSLYGSRFAVNSGFLTTSIRHDRGASADHLYCHRCRLAFLKRYSQEQLPIHPSAIANEFLVIGNLLLGERSYCEAMEAYQFAHLAHPIQPKSSQQLVHWFMTFLPPPWALMMQQMLRKWLGKYLKFKK
jgi:glycosyltransferase involved in cell wall biosynthesis